MRSIKLFVASMAMVVSMSVGGFTGKGYAQNVTETESVQDVSSQWVNSAQEYQYPISTEDEEWKSMTFKEQLDALQMPEKYLDVATTEELLELALSYPFNLDFMFYDDYDRGLEHLENSSNIFAELLSREDAPSVIAAAYITHEADYTILTSSVVKNSLSASEYDEEILLSALLTYDKVENKLDKEEIELVKEESYNKYEKKIGICEDYHTALMMSEFGTSFEVEITDVEKGTMTVAEVLATTGFVADGKTMYSPTNGATYYTGTYTKYNKTVDCLKYKSGDFTDAEKQELKEATLNAHPSWSYKGSATKKYNCHSYCWINKSYSNIYWLNNPDPFAASSTYFSSYGANVAITNSNSYVIINSEKGVEHSVRTITGANGISSGTNMTSWMTTTLCDSKIGSNGVYRTTLYDMYLLYDGVYYRVYTEK